MVHCSSRQLVLGFEARKVGQLFLAPCFSSLAHLQRHASIGKPATNDQIIVEQELCLDLFRENVAVRSGTVRFVPNTSQEEQEHYRIFFNYQKTHSFQVRLPSIPDLLLC
ncbi:hypothetical protein BDL97_01G034600 [Sphagnum fallax]|uniref:Uncharacterized protein n=1 Tax=Sphagnum jensenii TaxID=128206 RepID=A0ABP0VLM5_9BRYO|nr:hypothetical protein BDL97_01G034600 [Sphagnum fallax]